MSDYAKNDYIVEVSNKHSIWKQFNTPTRSFYMALRQLETARKRYKKVRLINTDEFGNRVISIY